MTRDEGIQLIKDQMSFRTNLDAEILRQFPLAQLQLEKMPTKPWFLLSEDSYVNTTAAEQRIPIPDDFLLETENAVLRYAPTDDSIPEVDLKKDDYDILRKNYFSEETGRTLVGPPEAYALFGYYFRLFPIPDGLYRLKMIYWKKALALTTNIENEWLKHAPMLMLGTVGKLITMGPVRDPTAAEIFNEWIAMDAGLTTNADEAREHANRVYQMGGPHN